ncbi:MAG: hypothetical protein Kow00117_23170 [Phototrophicales bacterium]
MSSLTLRRLIVWGVSAVLGILVSILILTFFLPAVNPSPTAGPVSVQDYGIQYFFWTAFPLTLVFVTIFDHFFETKILPD